MHFANNLRDMKSRLIAIIGLMAVFGIPIKAQYIGPNLRGDVGLKSGTQPDPGFYLVVPLYYRSDYTSIRLPSGNQVPGANDVTVSIFLPVVAATTSFKILGANYGFQIAPSIASQRQSVAGGLINRAEGYGLSESYIQPINLGWHTKHADFLAAYGFYAPTGPASLDMWSHELVAGTTVYLDGAKNWHAAGTMSYDINQRKRSADIKVGDYLTVEGGAGRSFIKGAASAGLSYVLQWKTTNDSGSAIPAYLPRGKNKAYGIGPELNLPFFAKGTVVGLVGFRYTFEMNNSTNFQGNNLVVSVTLAKLKAQ